MSQSPYIFDVTADDFDRFVIENSFHKAVLVDFWADWCAPCKALMPVLTKIVEGMQGELLLAKVNCDEQAALTERFGIRSLPTVVLFKDGQPVDGFAGVQPESAIRAMVEPYATAAEPAPAPEADVIEQATSLLNAGEPEQAIATLEAADNDARDEGFLLLLARALIAAKRPDEAQQVIESVPASDENKQALAGLRAQLTFAREAQALPPREQLESRLASDAKDTEALYQLSLRDLADGRYEPALDALLGLFQTDRDYADNSPQRTLLQVFDALGGNHSLTIQYRRRMYQALY
ncbi:thioredoxin [Halopseudomonas xinjiangensis]|uniref:Thioredoxin n=1 Tax=Halopseudomonas xinjiangensis TaxID=487184 RepID=A0A1H1WNM7_9GAMM|nr:thioredoxin [Halopseudomonas xinjiangensis]SDS98221.1 thioredoxin [Halopseudomonas xinjiangensis]